MLVAESLVADGIAERSTDALGPVAELAAAPLETMVGMTESSGREALEQHVVVPVRRRHHDGPRRGVAEDRTLDRGHPVGLEMLDHFDQRGGVETAQAGVAVAERALQQRQLGP